MKRRSFITAAMGGLALLPFVGKAVAQPQSKQEAGTWVLTHKESRSGLRCTDVRIILDEKVAQDALRSTEGEKVLVSYLKKQRGL